MNWDLENENRLRELAGQNLSARVIGMLMGCSKNVIIGKARRLGVALNGYVRDGMNAGTAVRGVEKRERGVEKREREYGTAARHNASQTPDVLSFIERTAGRERQLAEVRSHNSQKIAEAYHRRGGYFVAEPWSRAGRMQRTKAKTEDRIAAPVKTLLDVLPVVPAEIEDILTELRREPVCEAVEDLSGEGVSLLDLRDADCRAILDSGRYCGAPVHKSGSSWCKKHYDRFCQTVAQARRERQGRWS